MIKPVSFGKLYLGGKADSEKSIRTRKTYEDLKSTDAARVEWAKDYLQSQVDKTSDAVNISLDIEKLKMAERRSKNDPIQNHAGILMSLETSYKGRPLYVREYLNSAADKKSVADSTSQGFMKLASDYKKSAKSGDFYIVNLLKKYEKPSPETGFTIGCPFDSAEKKLAAFDSLERIIGGSEAVAEKMNKVIDTISSRYTPEERAQDPSLCGKLSFITRDNHTVIVKYEEKEFTYSTEVPYGKTDEAGAAIQLEKVSEWLKKH